MGVLLLPLTGTGCVRLNSLLTAGVLQYSWYGLAGGIGRAAWSLGNAAALRLLVRIGGFFAVLVACCVCVG